jgi:hypothetical protein
MVAVAPGRTVDFPVSPAVDNFIYTFAHMMGIPYGKWYRERFNLVMPYCLRVFEGGK